MRGLLACVFFVLFVSFVNGQRVQGFPSSVCGTQTFSTSYHSNLESNTFLVTSSSRSVIVSPTSVTYTSTNTVDITVRCDSLGPVELTFSTGGIEVDSVWLYCTGVISFANAPSSIVRGNEFELILELHPTPVQPVQVIVDPQNSLVIPGSERVFFGVEQQQANLLFYAPGSGDVGTAEILFKSRTLRDYNGPNCEDLRLFVDVQGTLTSDLSGRVVGRTETIPVKIFLDPPPLEPITIQIDASDAGSASPNVLSYGIAEFVQSFELTVSADAGSQPCVIVSGQYYEETAICFSVIGIIESNLPSEVNTYAIETFSVSITPPAGVNGVDMTITFSPNLVIYPFLRFEDGDDTEEFQIVGVDGMEGPAWVKFTADGYQSLYIELNVVEITCDSSSVISQDGTTCLQCPGEDYFAQQCSGNGLCAYSLLDAGSTRCVCEDDYYGAQCQYSSSDTSVEIYPFQITGLSFTTTVIPLTYTATVLVPPFLIQDGEQGVGRLFLEPVEADDFFSWTLVDPNEYIPQIDGADVRLIDSGFNMEVVAEFDNTEIITLNPSFVITFTFNPLKVSQRQFLQMELFVWFDGEWVTAQSLCPDQSRFITRDLLQMVYRTSVCTSGQYQFFEVAPTPFHEVVVDPQPNDPLNIDDDDDAALYFSGTGIAQAPTVPVPPQPTFVDRLGEPSLPKQQKSVPELNAVGSSTNSASSMSVLSVMMFLIIVALM